MQASESPHRYSPIVGSFGGGPSKPPDDRYALLQVPDFLAAVGAAAMALFTRGSRVSHHDEVEAQELVRDELSTAPVERRDV